MRHGWEPERITVAMQPLRSEAIWNRRVVRLARRLRPDVRRVLVVSLENEHDGIADQGRAFFRAGEQIDLPMGWGP